MTGPGRKPDGDGTNSIFLATGATGYLEGQLLVAMPSITDKRFARSVIYICAHSREGAMGLVINRLLGSMTLPDLLEQLGEKVPRARSDIRVHFGGPVEPGNGYVLHTADHMHDGSLEIGDNVALTATVDMLRDIAGGGGPSRNLLALGYAGWGPGQLDRELQDNSWLNVPSSHDLLFGRNIESKWQRAMGEIGVDVSQLSRTAGRA